MRRLLPIIAGILAAGVLGLASPGCHRTQSPEELARLALDADAAEPREMAAVELSQLGKPAREHLLQVLGQSEQPEVRVACIRGLAEQWDYRSMALLLDTLDDPSPLVRAQAGEAVQNMLRVDYGFRANDPPEKRQAVVKRLRAWWEQFQRSPRSQAFMRQQQGEEP